jgi:hypothetical protein
MTTRAYLPLAVLGLGLGLGVACPLCIPIPIPVPGPTLDVPGDPPVCDASVSTLTFHNQHTTCSMTVSVGASDGETVGPGTTAQFVFLMPGTYDVNVSSVTCTLNVNSCRITVPCGSDRVMTASGTGSTVIVNCSN